MKNVKIFDLNLAELAIRFYLMMAVIIVFSFLGQFTLAAILGYALALSFILGVRFREKTKKADEAGISRLLPTEKAIKKAA